MTKRIFLVIIVLSVLVSGCNSQKSGEKHPANITPSLWQSDKADSDLVRVVNFLINNKGKEVELAGEKYKITGKGKLNIEIKILSCCDEMGFRKYISAFGEVEDVKFPTFHASLPADTIPEFEKNGEITEIRLEPEANELWMKVLNQ